jgi:predicted HTH transcriptional regulator
VAENAEITTENIAKTIGITRRQVETNIRELKALGFVGREGGRRYGRWTVKLKNR